MIRTFCDQCGSELIGDKSNATSVRLEGQSGKIVVQVMVGTHGKNSVGWNTGHFCAGCVIDAVNTLDTRPTYTAQLPS